MEKRIFFDVMGVIFVVGDDTKDLLIPYIQKMHPNIGAETITEAYIAASIGNISSRDFWISMEFSEDSCSAVEKKYLDENITLDKHAANVLQELSDCYNIGLISNDISEWSCFLIAKYDLDKYLKFSIISGDIRCRKPQKQIYEYALEKANCSPDMCVFIDDRLNNLYPALELGMNVIKFNRAEASDTSLSLPQVVTVSEIPCKIKSIFNEKADHKHSSFSTIRQTARQKKTR